MTSSPRFPQSNALAEVKVKIAKQVVKKTNTTTWVKMFSWVFWVTIQNHKTTASDQEAYMGRVLHCAYRIMLTKSLFVHPIQPLLSLPSKIYSRGPLHFARYFKHWARWRSLEWTRHCSSAQVCDDDGRLGTEVSQRVRAMFRTSWMAASFAAVDWPTRELRCFRDDRLWSLYR